MLNSNLETKVPTVSVHIHIHYVISKINKVCSWWLMYHSDIITLTRCVLLSLTCVPFCFWLCQWTSPTQTKFHHLTLQRHTAHQGCEGVCVWYVEGRYTYVCEGERKGQRCIMAHVSRECFLKLGFYLKLARVQSTLTWKPLALCHKKEGKIILNEVAMTTENSATVAQCEGRPWAIRLPQ